VYMIDAVSVNEVGQMLTYTGTLAQITGGAAHGYSRSMEEAVTCPVTGVLLNPDMIDYKCATLLDTPSIQGFPVESRMGYGPYGCCGLGEDCSTVIGGMMPFAVYNATGVWVNDCPVTPARLLKALGKA
jgi:CO/xanthine dehydrogenase Mo-binding subunit